MKKFLMFASATALLISACSESKHSNSWEEENSGEEYANSFSSSSALSDRYDISYGDTLVLNDTNELYFELAKIDTLKDTTGAITYKKNCSEGFICLDSLNAEVSFYLGEFPKGTRISLSTRASALKNDTIHVRSESGLNLNALLPIYDSKLKDSIFADYIIPGESQNLKNRFAAFNKDFYYVSLKGNFDKTAQISLYVAVDSSYFGYLGDSSRISIDIKDTLHGIIPFASAPNKVYVDFNAPVGYSISINALGQWITDYTLIQGKKDTLATKKMPNSYYSETNKGRDSLGLKTLMPIDATNWTVVLSPMGMEYDLSGHYALFDVVTNSRQLLQGEYLAKPDSILQPGDTTFNKRPYSIDYVLRREQYIWLANVKAKDSLEVYHRMEGFMTSVGKQNTTIINAKGAELATINSLNTHFVAKEDGPVYLHYVSTCASKNEYDGCGELIDNEDETLKFYTVVSQYGSLTSIKFYDIRLGTYETKVVSAGDVLTLADFAFQTAPTSASKNVTWFIPCSELTGSEATNLFNLQSPACTSGSGTEQPLSSTKLTVKADAVAGTKARLIAQSLADPTKRAILTVMVRDSD